MTGIGIDRRSINRTKLAVATSGERTRIQTRLFVCRRTVGSIEEPQILDLIPDVGSVTPPGAVTVAVFDKIPVAPAEMFAVTV